MVIVDTSVWIRFLANRSPFASRLDELLAANQVLGHDLVLGELLIGDRGGRAKLLSAYDHLPRATSVPHADVVSLVRARRLHGLGVGWIDIHILASALTGKHEVWTADPRFAAAAQTLGVSYLPGA